MNIEKMALAHLKSVVQLDKEAFGDNAYSEQLFKNELSDDSQQKMFVLTQDEQVIGYGQISLCYEDCDLNKIVIKKEFRNMGYGQRLLNYLCSYANEHGCEKMHLEVSMRNHVAIDFYEKNNFVLTRVQKDYYPNNCDAWDMVKDIKGCKARKLLAIESSCDETACAIIDENYHVYSSVVTSQIDVHARFGGVIPEIASRMHVEQISTIVDQAVKKAGVEMKDICAIAYTIGPGLIGSLHVGALAAKSLAYFYDLPLIGVHHLKGHIFVNEMIKPLQYPMLALVVSGGHTELVYIENDLSFKIIGTTLDDAVGEAYDKVARVMGQPYPGGPVIDALAKKGKEHYKLPTPKVDGLNFSFSGLKNAVFQLVKKEETAGREIDDNDLAYAFQETALNSLIKKAKIAADSYPCKSVVIAGGVAANSRLRELMKENFADKDLILPPLKYCTDNALMIACAGLHYLKNKKFVSLDAPSAPSMSIEQD